MQVQLHIQAVLSGVGREKTRRQQKSVSLFLYGPITKTSCQTLLGPILPPPPLGPRGETHSLAGEGVGGPNSNEGTDTMVLYVYYKLLYVSLWRYTEFHTWKKSRNSVKFRGISRNSTTRNSAEFRRNCSQFRTEYGIDGSKKNRRNSVSAEFRGHPIWED